MADGTVIVGVAGILVSGVLGPLVAHHAHKDRESRDDRLKAIDGATDALVAAGTDVRWLSGAHLERDERERRFEALLRLIDLTDSYSVKLEMRFGDSALVESYTHAGEALRDAAAALWDREHGHKFREVVARILSDAETRHAAESKRFRSAARRWHNDLL